ncbi:MAG: hypothetical protein QOH51_778, partial [Acidobacteriota bacterium]|nr:hypothetical protein [Acidobacteriota bacterium]
MFTNTLPPAADCITQLIQCLRIRASSTASFKKNPATLSWVAGVKRRVAASTTVREGVWKDELGTMNDEL